MRAKTGQVLHSCSLYTGVLRCLQPQQVRTTAINSVGSTKITQNDLKMRWKVFTCNLGLGAASEVIPALFE